jgi:DNA-directed RNA polymerase specialized sigma24 family protein
VQNGANGRVKPGEHIRRELLDLSKYYRAQRRKPEGERPIPLGGNDTSLTGPNPSYHDEPHEDCEQWQALHEIIAELPTLDREVVTWRAL